MNELVKTPKTSSRCSAFASPAARRAIVSRCPRQAARLRAGRRASATSAASSAPAVLEQYCITCHNERTKAGGLALDTLDFDQVGTDAETWEKVVRKDPNRHDAAERRATARRSGARRVRDRSRNPSRSSGRAGSGPEAPGAAPAQSHRIRQRDSRSARAGCRRRDAAAGRRVERRLRQHRRSAGMSPSLIQGYVSAAMKISRRAVGDRTLTPTQVTYPAPPGAGAGPPHRGSPAWNSRRHARDATRFRSMREYEFSVDRRRRRWRRAAGGGATIDVTLDGDKLTRRPIRAASESRSRRDRTSIGVARDRSAAVGRRRRSSISDFRINSVFTPGGGVQKVTITGPFSATGLGDTPSRRRIFVCRPAHRRSRKATCARKIVTALGRRAYRRALVDDEVETLMALLSAGAQREATSRLASSTRWRGSWSRPRFPLPDRGRARRRAGRAPPTASAISSWRRGCRSSCGAASPTIELLDAAAKGRLSDPLVLEQQVKRMLADPKVGSTDQELRRSMVVPAGARGRADRRRRTSTTTCGRRSGARRRCFLDSIVREDRSMLDLIDADYTFVDERLARHYGIPEYPRQLLPTRAARSDEPAARSARAGQHADGHVGRDAHVAGVARQVDSRKPPGHAARRFRRRVSKPISRKSGGSESRRRCGSAWKCTARIRCARRATRSWTRSGLRSRTSTRSATGANATAGRRSMPRVSWSTAPRSVVPPICGRRCSVASQMLRDRGHRAASDLCAGPAVRVLRHADGARDRAAGGSE